MLVWVKIRKGGNFKIQKVLVGARSINNINTFLIFYLPPRYKCPFKKTPPPPLKSPYFTREPTKTTMVLLLKKNLLLYLYLTISVQYISYLSWISAYQSILPTFYEQLIWLKQKQKKTLLLTTKNTFFWVKWSPFWHVNFKEKEHGEMHIYPPQNSPKKSQKVPMKKNLPPKSEKTK